MPTPIQMLFFFHEESNSNFETTMLSQIFLLVQITKLLGERKTRVEKDVADMKYIMTLGDDDDMVLIIPRQTL